MKIIEWLSAESPLDEILSTQPFDFNEINRLSAKQSAPFWIWWSFWLEVILIFSSGAWAIFCASIFYKSRHLFHRNLVILAVNIMFLWWTMEISRLIVCIGGLFIDTEILQNLSVFLVKPPFIYVELVRTWSGYAAIATMAGIICERIIATKRLDFYERITSPIFVGFLILMSWLIGLCGSLLIFYSPATVVLSILMGMILILFVGMGYSYVNKVNISEFRKSKLDSNLYTLSQAFQLRENIRVLKIIRRFIMTFMGCLSVLFGVFTLGLLSQSASTSNTQIYLVRTLGNVTCSVVGPIMIYSAITGTYIWEQDLHRQLRSIPLFCRNRNAVVSIRKQPTHLQNLDGRRLAFSIGEEQKIYFQQLKQAWS